MTNIDRGDANVPPAAPGPGIPVGQSAPDMRPHRPAGDTEEVYFEGSPLLRGELGKGLPWILAGLLIFGAPFLIHFLSETHVPWWGWLAFIVVGVVAMFVPFLRAKMYRYRITNYRIDFERGLLSRNIDTLELWHVEDLRFHQSLLDRLLGIGTITVLSKHPTTPLLVIRSIPNAQKLFTTLEQRVIAVKRQAGVIKVDTGTAGST